MLKSGCMVPVWLLFTLDIWLLGRAALFYINPNIGVGKVDLAVMIVVAVILLPLYFKGRKRHND